MYDKFTVCQLDANASFYSGSLPNDLIPSGEQFQAIWDLHPAEYHDIMMHGRMVKTPRWQQAYGADYHYTGRVNKALPIPSMLHSLVTWVLANIDDRLNGVLVNWYDGQLKHYIGAHRDSRKNMLAGAPIVTVSFGEERMFRLRPYKGTGYRNFRTSNGSVFIMPYQTNLRWTHEVPHSRVQRGRRISVTFRAFEAGVLA